MNLEILKYNWRSAAATATKAWVITKKISIKLSLYLSIFENSQLAMEWSLDALNFQKSSLICWNLSAENFHTGFNNDLRLFLNHYNSPKYLTAFHNGKNWNEVGIRLKLMIIFQIFSK